MKVFLTNFHYKKHFTPVQMIMAGVLYAVLSLPSLVYLCIVKTRNFLYKKNLLKSYKPHLYTVSVGNLTTGGTGKTPILLQKKATILLSFQEATEGSCLIKTLMLYLMGSQSITMLWKRAMNHTGLPLIALNVLF